MPWNILILPLLGGFIFVNWFYETRFTVRRVGRYRLLLFAAVAAVVLLVSSRAITYLAAPHISAGLERQIQMFAPFAFIGTSFLAFVLGLSAFPINCFLDKQSAERRAIERSGDRLEVLLDRALLEVKYVSATLTNGKVYIGLVTDSPDPTRDREYVKLLPLHSGYRRTVDKSLVITTDYSNVLSEIDHDDGIDLDPEDFELVIPVSQILTISLFDWDAYALFNPSSLAGPPSQTELFG